MTTKIGVPNLIWSDLRRHIAICGMDDESRGTYNAMQYAQCLMDEIEFTEMYKNGSDAYRAASDATVKMINHKGGK